MVHTSSVSIAAMTMLWGLLAQLTSPRAAIALAGVLVLGAPFLLPRQNKRVQIGMRSRSSPPTGLPNSASAPARWVSWRTVCGGAPRRDGAFGGTTSWGGGDRRGAPLDVGRGSQR